MVFLPIFAEKGGVWAQSKNPYQKKTEVVKKKGGGLRILTKSKKNSFLMPPLTGIISITAMTKKSKTCFIIKEKTMSHLFLFFSAGGVCGLFTQVESSN